MKTISIRELHLFTGRLVRRAGNRESMVITDHGKPIATLQPYMRLQPGRGFTPDHEKWVSSLRRISVDSADLIAEDRGG